MSEVVSTVSRNNFQVSTFKDNSIVVENKDPNLAPDGARIITIFKNGEVKAYTKEGEFIQPAPTHVTSGNATLIINAPASQSSEKPVLTIQDKDGYSLQMFPDGVYYQILSEPAKDVQSKLPQSLPQFAVQSVVSGTQRPSATPADFERQSKIAKTH